MWLYKYVKPVLATTRFIVHETRKVVAYAKTHQKLHKSTKTFKTIPKPQNPYLMINKNINKWKKRYQ